MSSWLLLLGSNVDGDTRIDVATLALSKLGQVDALTPTMVFPADGMVPGRFYNALRRLDSEFVRARLRDELHTIEVGLGRNRCLNDTVAIDIDILARQYRGHWYWDAHALAKNEHQRSMVKTLLCKAGITLRP